jgi:hypothetical protein
MRTRPFDAVGNWALWLLFAVALCLSVILLIPDLRAAVLPRDTIVLACAAIVAWIFALSRAIGPTRNLLSRNKHPRDWSGKGD